MIASACCRSAWRPSAGSPAPSPGAPPGRRSLRGRRTVVDRVDERMQVRVVTAEGGRFDPALACIGDRRVQRHRVRSEEMPGQPDEPGDDRAAERDQLRRHRGAAAHRRRRTAEQHHDECSTSRAEHNEEWRVRDDSCVAVSLAHTSPSPNARLTSTRAARRITSAGNFSDGERLGACHRTEASGRAITQSMRYRTVSA